MTAAAHGASPIGCADAVTIHELKTMAPYWDAVEAGAKPFEVRRDDRGFQRGDVLALHRMRQDQPHRYDDAGANGYLITKRTLYRRITYVLTGGQFGVEPGYVVLGLGEINACAIAETPHSVEGVNTSSLTHEG